MEITGEMIKKLRERTGAGVLDCKTALSENSGDEEKAVEYLLKKGMAKAVKKAGRISTEGMIGAYLHTGNKIGVMIEVNCESDFVAKTDEFKLLVKDICMQITALNADFIRREDVSPEKLEKQKEIFLAQVKESGKPEKIWDKIIEGKLVAWYKEVCLVEQTFIKDDKKTIQDMINECTLKLGEKISIRRFSRYEVGEGLEKRKDDLQAEVNKMIEGQG